MDFVSDCVSGGKVIRMLTIVDDCTRECPAIEVDTSLGGLRVRRVLERMAIGARAAGSDCCGQRAGVSRPGPSSLERGTWGATGVHSAGQASQNAYVESFNGRLRDECLNANWFTRLERRTEKNRKLGGKDYNEQRPHSSLNYLPPAEFARTATEMRA